MKLDGVNMGAQDVKRRLWSQLRNSRLGLIVILIFLSIDSFVHGQEYVSYGTERAALFTLWEAWQDTPVSLGGWGTESDSLATICGFWDLNSDSTLDTGSWQGVQCTAQCNDTIIDTNCTVRVVHVIGLRLSDMSIVGTLPPAAFSNLTALSSLELTGNPNLTGPLPQELQYTSITNLDFHDNGFTGTIPNLPGFWNLLRLNLSGNKFTGPYPLEQFSSMNYLQELSIGDNLLYGEIPPGAFKMKKALYILNLAGNKFTGLYPLEQFRTVNSLMFLDIGRNLLYGEIHADAFANMTELVTLDISDNNFNGTLPSFSSMNYLTHLDVSGNHFEGELPDLRGLSVSLRYVNLARNRFHGKVDLLDIFNLNVSTSLTEVHLSHNQLTGTLPSWNASSLGSIQQLYLDNNSLSGVLNISQMFAAGLLEDRNPAGKLKIMSLSNNSIERVISDPNIIATITTHFILQGNPYCENYNSNNDAQRCYCSQRCIVTPAKVDNRKIIIIAATISLLIVVLILLIVVGIVLFKNTRYKRYLQLQFEQKFEEFDVKPTIFSYTEIRNATRDFHEDMKLGHGAYGAVYKGVLPSGHVVAVKQLYKTAQGHDEFLNEVILITSMKHRNLVNLKGCCLRESQRLLVYEYVDNYDIDQILLGSRKEEMSAQLASWPVRLKICLGIAHGLHYLHAMAHPRVIHRDIKAGNVLINSSMEPKIADFGLALLFPDEETHIMTVHVAGTKGYLAPEYASLGQLSDKVDVYSFGVLCLEIISGRRNIDNNAPVDQVYLSKWAWQLHKQARLMELVDPTLRLTNQELCEVQRIIKMCLLCISFAVERRPSMAHIVSILQGDTKSEVHVLEDGTKFTSNWSQITSAYFTSGIESEGESSSFSLNGLHRKPQSLQ